MNKRTRYFAVGSVAIVVVGLCTGLVAFYNGGLTLTSSSQGPAEMAYLPADATGVAYANVRDVMNSEFRQKLGEAIPTGEERDEFMKETGIDIERDIDTVVAAVSANKDVAVVLVRGRFNELQIESLVRQGGGEVEQYQGIRVVTAGRQVQQGMLDGANGDMPRDVAVHAGTPSVAFLETGLLAIGEKAAVKAAIDSKTSGQNATANAELMKYVNEIRAGQSVWAVGRFEDLQKQAEIPDQIKQHLPAVKWFAVTGLVNGGISGSVRAETSDDAAAENLRDVIRGGLAMGRLVSGQDPKFQLLMDSLQMSGTGKTVSLSFAISPEMVDVLAGLAQMSEPKKIQ
jgi:hypothetical protein